VRTLPRAHHQAAPAPPDHAGRLVRLLGIYPGPSAAMGSVAALAGVPGPVARAAVARLAAEGLVDTVGGRVVVPARLRAATADNAETRAARDRLLRYLLARAIAAAAVAIPDGPAVALPPFRSAAGAWDWLASELPTLLAIPDPAFALRLAPALGEHLAEVDALLLYRRAARGGDPGMRLRLGLALCRLGRYGEGAEHLRAALPRLELPADRAAALLRLADCLDREGRRLEALAWYAEAYEACLHAGDGAGRAVAEQRLRARAAA